MVAIIISKAVNSKVYTDYYRARMLLMASGIVDKCHPYWQDDSTKQKETDELVDLNNSSYYDKQKFCGRRNINFQSSSLLLSVFCIVIILIFLTFLLICLLQLHLWMASSKGLHVALISTLIHVPPSSLLSHQGFCVILVIGSIHQVHNTFVKLYKCTHDHNIVTEEKLSETSL